MSKHHTVIMLRDARTALLRNKLSGPLTAGLLAHIKMLEAEIEREREADAKHAELMRVGKSAYSSIADMVAALNCDYDRLGELREERDAHHATVAAYAEKMDDWQANADAQAALEELAELESQAGECTSREDAEQRIQEDALSVEVRSDWYSPGGDGDTGMPTEFKILLSTGGPASRIVGELNQYGEPISAKLEVQDWFMPWTEYNGDEVSESVLLDYARCFYFGEG